MSEIAPTSQSADGGHGDAAAYALGALDEAARSRFEAHLVTCAECMRELQEIGAVTDHLALAVVQVEPSPQVRARLLTRARSLAVSRSTSGAAAVAPSTATVPLSAASVAYRRAERRWLGERTSMAVAVLSLLVALGGSGYAFAEHQQMQHTAQAAASLTETLSIMYQPGMVARSLSGTDMSPQARGKMWLNPDSSEVVVMTYDLPPLSRSEAYQCWLTGDERRASAGVFRVDERGRGHWIIRAPATLSRFRTIGVTREPARGSINPTGPRMLFGTIE